MESESPGPGPSLEEKGLTVQVKHGTKRLEGDGDDEERRETGTTRL